MAAAYPRAGVGEAGFATIATMPYNKSVQTGKWMGDAHPEIDAPQEGRWIAKPRKPRWALPAVATAILSSQVPNMVHVWVGGGSHSLVFRFVVGLLLLGITGILLLSEFRAVLARRMRSEDCALIDGAFGDQFPVEFTIIVSGKRLGTDRGVVWFADGLMGFSGSASSFVLAAGDLAPDWAAAKRNARWNQLPPGAILLCKAPKVAYMVINPLSGHGKAYQYRFGKFIGMNEVVDGERFWPPLVPYGEGVASQEGERVEVVRS